MAPKTEEEINNIDIDDGLVYPESLGNSDQRIIWDENKSTRTDTAKEMDRQSYEWDDYI